MYAIVVKNGKTYAAHVCDAELPRFDSARAVSRSGYREARANGVPSWGESQTRRKMEDTIRKRGDRNHKAVRPTR